MVRARSFGTLALLVFAMIEEVQRSAAAADATRGALAVSLFHDLSGAVAACPGAGSNGYAVAESYNRYTVVSESLEPGTPVDVALEWTLAGAFSDLASAEPWASPAGAVGFRITVLLPQPYDPPYFPELVVAEFPSSDQAAGWSLQGTIDLGAIYPRTGRPLAVGESFIVNAQLIVQTSVIPLYGTPATFLADFSAAAAPTVTTSGATAIGETR